MISPRGKGGTDPKIDSPYQGGEQKRGVRSQRAQRAIMQLLSLHRYGHSMIAASASAAE